MSDLKGSSEGPFRSLVWSQPRSIIELVGLSRDLISLGCRIAVGSRGGGGRRPPTLKSALLVFPSSLPLAFLASPPPLFPPHLISFSNPEFIPLTDAAADADAAAAGQAARNSPSSLERGTKDGTSAGRRNGRPPLPRNGDS